MLPNLPNPRNPQDKRISILSLQQLSKLKLQIQEIGAKTDQEKEDLTYSEDDPEEPKNPIIGSDVTHLAFVDAQNYLIGTMRNGIKLIQGDKELFAAKLPITGAMLRDMVYVKHMDCYFKVVEISFD